ncbi:phage tail protein [Citrobacter sp. FDAARGOS_156]|uniref:phage tail-collar fiber domain-containing protein n=1 Tax=Citrobacter sp. FDAARGOS_156 TaxID=1702170 RepID=UPI001F16254D|nr:phage tail protein [Citrobacter sp. FDAARGOS_156]
MSQTAITLAFEQRKAQQGATGEPVVLDEFVFANVPGLDPDVPIDRAEVLPPESQIVHREAVSRKGVVNDNAVVHSVVLGADVGDFSFNWIGLINKTSGKLAMIVHAPIQQKLKTAEGQQGNVLTRSFLMEYNGAQAETGINTPAETWQIDFTARMAGMDERQRLENADIYGAAAFFGDGYLLGKTGNQYFVTKGTGYVAGLRTSLAENQNITVTTKPVKVWLDVCWMGSLTSVWNVQRKITVAENLADYVQNGEQHYVFAVASIDVNGNITDLRPKGALNEQQASDALKKHEQSRNHPDATTSEKGFTRLSSATDNDSEELAATSKAVKIAMDNANARLAKDRNGADIPNPPLFVQNVGLKPTVDKAANAVDKNGDTMTGGLTLVESDVVLKTSSSDSPQYTIINTTTGASVNMDLIDKRFRIFGVPWGGGPVKQFTFNLETGEFGIPQANIRFGSGIIQADANIYGAAWGENGNSGWINMWITNRINDAKTWVNQNFVAGVKRGAQSSMVMDGGLVEAPSGCVLTGGNGNESNQVGIALYRPLQVWRNGGWVTIGD